MEKIKTFLLNILKGFGEVPDLLRSKIQLKLFGALGLFITGIVFVFTKQNYSLWLMAFGLCLGLIFLAGKTIYDWQAGKVIRLEGYCVESILNLTKSKTRKILIQTEDKRVQIRIKEKVKQISKGDYVVLYIHSDSSVGVEDNVYILNDYLAIKITTANENENDAEPQKISEIASLFRKK